MKRYGLIGHPLEHSFSQAIFNGKFAREHIDAEYDVFDLESIDLFLQFLIQYPDIRGFNITIPFKESIISFLDALDPVAAEVGAVNTVKVVKGDLIGYNTDVIGIESTLHSIASFTVDEPLGDSKSLVEKMSQKVTALILGTGGASKAVQYVLKKQGLPYHLVSRSAKRGDFTYKMLTPEIIRNHQLIINATPVGMAPHTKKAPSIPYEAITREHTLFDLIYNPEETLFLRYGREHGAQTINGLTMLHAQAQATWEIWSSLR